MMAARAITTIPACVGLRRRRIVVMALAAITTIPACVGLRSRRIVVMALAAIMLTTSSAKILRAPLLSLCRVAKMAVVL